MRTPRQHAITIAKRLWRGCAIRTEDGGHICIVWKRDEGRVGWDSIVTGSTWEAVLGKLALLQAQRTR